MKVFVLLEKKKVSVFEFTEARLRMYQRLLRLHQENSAGLTHVLRAFTWREPLAEKYTCDYPEAYQGIIWQLHGVKFLLRNSRGRLELNPSQIGFINFIIKSEEAWRGLLSGGFKPASASLRTDILTADLDKNELVNLMKIKPEIIALEEEKNDGGCRLM